MRFKFILAIALILCAFCVLPVNAGLLVPQPSQFDYIPFPEFIPVTHEYIENYEIDYNTYFDLSEIFSQYDQYAQIPDPFYSDVFGDDIAIYRSTISSYNYITNPITYNQTITLQYYNKELVYVDEYEDTSNALSLIILTITVKNAPISSAQFNITKIGEDEQSVTYQVFAESTDINDEILFSSIETYSNITVDSWLSSEQTLKNFRVTQNELEIYCKWTSITTGQTGTMSTILTGKKSDIIQAYIQTWDYNTGNMVSGVNMSVYEVIDHDTYAELGTLIYTSRNAQSQTVLELKNNTDYFVINNLDGYYAVKNQDYPYFNNINGYWWTPAVSNPLWLYYAKIDESALYNAPIRVHDVYQNGISGVSVTMDNSQTLITNNLGWVSFNNVSAGQHTFVFIKNGYQSQQQTFDIYLQYASFDIMMFEDNQIIQPTVSPTAYPTAYPTVSPTAQPTLSPIDKPTNIMESVSFGFAKIFGIKTVENANYIFALMLILFPAVVAGGITHQALGFIAGGMVGFVFALAVGLIPIWVFFAMCLMAVIYFVLKGGNEGF